jgi:hypothetical protein
MNAFGAEDLLRLDRQHRAELAASWPPPGDHRVHRHVHRVARSAFVAIHKAPAAPNKTLGHR